MLIEESNAALHLLAGLLNGFSSSLLSREFLLLSSLGVESRHSCLFICLLLLHALALFGQVSGSLLRC